MFVRENLLQRKLRSFAWRILNYTDNLNNSTFSKNGEEAFLFSLGKYWEDHQNKNGRIILDVGANVGGYSEMFLKMMPSITGGFICLKPKNV
ncbi:hypothetical protein AGMMS49546_27020 [Spirochaetia bacterium]|nr:hypothetical protein AGMMS49546_27020 [Spirochaetia bacterium]